MWDAMFLCRCDCGYDIVAFVACGIGSEKRYLSATVCYLLAATLPLNLRPEAYTTLVVYEASVRLRDSSTVAERQRKANRSSGGKKEGLRVRCP